MNNVLDTHVGAYEGTNLYDFDNDIQLNWYPKRVIEHATGARSMLELGVGHGFSTKLFSEYFQRYVVVDASTAVIENFHKKFPGLDVHVEQAYFEEFETQERFDVVVLGFVLEHVDDPVLIMSLYKKLLAPGGKMFLSVPNAEVLNRRLGYEAGMLKDMTELSEHDHLCGHKRYYSVDTLTQDIHRAGCKVERMEGIYLKPLTTVQMKSHNFDDKVIEAFCKVGIDYPELCCGILAEISAS
jgi:2-polyprenyl-3-methyl-5-hydroxy-6-metoxy-1,4-benzoquinol methylase